MNQLNNDLKSKIPKIVCNNNTMCTSLIKNNNTSNNALPLTTTTNKISKSLPSALQITSKYQKNLDKNMMSIEQSKIKDSPTLKSEK
jgi:hypothetical protein